MKHLYNDTVFEYFARRCEYAGELIQSTQSECGTQSAEPQYRCGCGTAGVAGNGDVVEFYVEIDRGNKIIQARFKAYGCVATIAGGTMICETICQKDVKDAIQLDARTISSKLGLPKTKRHCALLLEDALKAALAETSK